MAGDHILVASDQYGLQILAMPPVITECKLAGTQVRVSWNAAAQGMTLQCATNLTNQDWKSLFGYEGTNTALLPLGLESGFFRLVKP